MQKLTLRCYASASYAGLRQTGRPSPARSQTHVNEVPIYKLDVLGAVCLLEVWPEPVRIKITQLHQSKGFVGNDRPIVFSGNNIMERHRNVSWLKRERE